MSSTWLSVCMGGDEALSPSGQNLTSVPAVRPLTIPFRRFSAQPQTVSDGWKADFNSRGFMGGLAPSADLCATALRLPH
jgi:hypothetical protein